jgi:Uri superfamily endonuclease
MMQAPVNLPAGPGTYVLIVRLDSPTTLAAGRLGPVSLAGGIYAYVGSARGPGGLSARVGRHLRKFGKMPHWHIDALLAHAAVIEIWLIEASDRLECAWAHAIAGVSGVEQPVAGFGASDCACRAHLFRLPAEAISAAWEALGEPIRIGCDAAQDSA